MLKKVLNRSKPLMNATFRSTVRTYMKQLNNENIAYLIKAANSDFVDIIFVMREDEIKDNAENRYECFGIVIPHELLVQYLCRWIDLTLLIAYSVREYIDDNRSFMNLTFNSCIRILMRAQFTEYYQYYIQLENMDILNSMFVMTEEDIMNRSGSRHECIGVIIRDDLIQPYIRKWFEYVTNADSVKEYMNANRPLKNTTFKTALRTFLRQLDRYNIENLIQTGSSTFVYTMFVMTAVDFKDNAENRLECFGIVIPCDLLMQYIARLFDGLTKTDGVKKSIYTNRCFMNGAFRIAL
ncbi:unnamed protein product [Mytilus edulis]|uniref:Uncharacterized protein n=1 Tax=Mytilus edulis TaxID=6550 RepID=A0A8S3SQX3_MYTED|nr:unnamed protein product [Mytilus edulis]